MLKSPKTALFLVAVILTACSSASSFQATKSQTPPPPPPPEAKIGFQFGQSATIRLDKRLDPALQTAFLHWVYQGVYAEAPVYRQFPGVFLLTGKPRLAGQGFQYGTIPTPNPDIKHPESKTGQVGLVIHSDGTVGPELIIHYGYGVVSCCEAPANIRIGTIIEGKRSLKTVQRGDNLTNIAIQP